MEKIVKTEKSRSCCSCFASDDEPVFEGKELIRELSRLVSALADLEERDPSTEFSPRFQALRLVLIRINENYSENPETPQPFPLERLRVY
jgi:hypothetical protein